MRWPYVTSAAWKPRWLYAAKASTAPCQPTSADACPIAPFTSNPPLTAAPLRLELRASRVCNRNPKAVAQYLQTHRNLRKGAYFDGMAND